MKEARRGDLPGEKAETEEKIQRLRAQLTAMRTVLTKLGNALRKHPERVFFPNTLQRHWVALRQDPKFPWDEVLDKGAMKDLIDELREALDHLALVRRQLASMCGKRSNQAGENRSVELTLGEPRGGS